MIAIDINHAADACCAEAKTRIGRLSFVHGVWLTK
jgi:hypothetical protein